MVEIIPKLAPERPLWQEILFYLGIVLLVAAIGAYFGLGYLQKEGTDKIQSLEEQISAVRTAEVTALKKDLSAKEEKINNFSNLLDNHRITTALFPFLGQICHPQVQFLSLEFNASSQGYTVGIPAKAESFRALYQQLLILKDQDLVTKMEVAGIALGKEGGIDFKLDLSLSPKIFKFE